MRSLHNLVNVKEPAWPLVQGWIDKAATRVEVLPAERAAGEAALLGMQITARSPMGAIAYHSAGILIDSGWLRVLGAGGHARFQRSLPGWNKELGHGFCLMADDAVGGFFAVNGGGLGSDRGSVFYYAPDALRWEPCGLGYTDFVVWALSGKLDEFAKDLRWPGWRSEVKSLTADQTINFYPFLFAEGPPLKKRVRRAVPVEEQYLLQLDLQRQLDDSRAAEK